MHSKKPPASASNILNAITFKMLWENDYDIVWKFQIPYATFLFLCYFGPVPVGSSKSGIGSAPFRFRKIHFIQIRSGYDQIYLI